MTHKYLGEAFDIHGGGLDLIFPHHENEIAQSRCADHAPVFADYWMHNGFLTMDAEKMSKSLGNVLLVHDLIQQVPGEAIRWALLSAHYRAPLDWTGDLLIQSRKSLDRLYGALSDASALLASSGYDPSLSQQSQTAPQLALVMEALEDDLNTPRAIAELFGLADQLRALLPTAADKGELDLVRVYRDALVEAGSVMGFLQADPDAWFHGDADDGLKAKVEELIAARFEARRTKDWATADRIRDELTALNIVVMDNPDGATWRLKD